jgi:hypothetical protein
MSKPKTLVVGMLVTFIPCGSLKELEGVIGTVIECSGWPSDIYHIRFKGVPYDENRDYYRLLIDAVQIYTPPVIDL